MAQLEYEAVRDRLLTPLVESSFRSTSEGMDFLMELMAEYLRRMALWCVDLDCGHLTVRDNRIWPLGCLIAVLVPEAAVDPEVEADAERFRKEGPAGRAETRLAYNILAWAKYYSQAPLLKEIGLADPFEPALMFFEGNGDFWTEHGYICPPGSMLWVGQPQKWLPLEKQTREKRKNRR